MKQALFSPLILGNVNKNFQDRAGLGRPLSDLLFKPLQMLSYGQATAYMAMVQTSKQGHCTFSLASGKRTKAREPKVPSAISLWSQATGFMTSQTSQESFRSEEWQDTSQAFKIAFSPNPEICRQSSVTPQISGYWRVLKVASVTV